MKPRRQARTGAALAAALLAAVGSAGAQTPTEVRAPHLQPDLKTMEGGLWDMSDQNERHVKASAELDRDPALTAHVKGVMCKVAQEYCDDLRVYVLDRPFLNAAAAPNGYVEVYSGLLLRVRDEDELAFVLGHEVSHFARNHTLAQWRVQKSNANTAMIVGIGIGVAAAVATAGVASSGSASAANGAQAISTGARGLIDLTYLSAVARTFAFSREQEGEADRLGYGRAYAAGYDPAAGRDLWTDQTAETQASAFKKVREGATRASIFDTHPVDADRIAALNKLRAAAPPATRDRQASAVQWRAVIRPHLAAWLKDDLRRRDWGQTLHLIARLEGEGEDLGVLNFYRGEVYRLRREDGDPALARGAYAAAVTHPDAPPAAWRELGEAARKGGDPAAARAAFAAYLTHAPDAQDRWLVEADLKSM